MGNQWAFYNNSSVFLHIAKKMEKESELERFVKHSLDSKMSEREFSLSLSSQG